MAGEPAANGRDVPADCAGEVDASAAAAGALLSAASEQLTMVYHGEVYVFDPVPPPKVAPSAPFRIPSLSVLPFSIDTRVDLFRWSLFALGRS
ncbi:hypothetical protein PR202_gb11056 [Eleusine coracana subsp. coracana]|uniref:Tify domain-containing protein n=1 Tax=Eleusine coracana subsp. coracana TaxID=191504 RepID=A0AAV5EM28_ELECO|nr:hypothetical protein PR202_gb11056 [Eleusine coracana subsp. coracana]